MVEKTMMVATRKQIVDMNRVGMSVSCVFILMLDRTRWASRVSRHWADLCRNAGAEDARPRSDPPQARPCIRRQAVPLGGGSPRNARSTVRRAASMRL